MTSPDACLRYPTCGWRRPRPPAHQGRRHPHDLTPSTTGSTSGEAGSRARSQDRQRSTRSMLAPLRYRTRLRSRALRPRLARCGVAHCRPSASQVEMVLERRRCGPAGGPAACSGIASQIRVPGRTPGRRARSTGGPVPSSNGPAPRTGPGFGPWPPPPPAATCSSSSPMVTPDPRSTSWSRSLRLWNRSATRLGRVRRGRRRRPRAAPRRQSGRAHPRHHRQCGLAPTGPPGRHRRWELGPHHVQRTPRRMAGDLGLVLDTGPTGMSDLDIDDRRRQPGHRHLTTPPRSTTAASSRRSSS